MNAAFTTLATVLKGIAPTMATMLGGPLAGDAVTALEGVFGLTPSADKAASANAITSLIQSGNATAEQLAAARVADQAHEEKMKSLDIDLARLNADTQASLDTAIVDDVKDARAAAKGNDKVYDVGLFILGSFLIAMIAVLWGCWALISGQVRITPEMAGMFAAITGLVGTIVGYFASNAQTVINFLFGGSLGGRKNADALSDSVQSMGNALGKAANAPTPILATR